MNRQQRRHWLKLNRGANRGTKGNNGHHRASRQQPHRSMGIDGSGYLVGQFLRERGNAGLTPNEVAERNAVQGNLLDALYNMVSPDPTQPV